MAYCVDMAASVETMQRCGVMSSSGPVTFEYKESGGLPAAFELAAKAIPDSASLDPDIRLYRSELAKVLPGAFSSLLRYVENENGSKLVEAIARIHVGITNTADFALIKNHRWGALFLHEHAKETRLSCDALGRAALAMVISQGTASWVDPKRFMSRDSIGPATRH